MIRLLAIDIDGTLLDSRGGLPDAHRDALIEASARGVEVALVTGRSFHFAGAVVDLLPIPLTLIVNNGAVPVLVLDGEELVGAKQNRIVNLTILVAARQTLHVPVSCVEAGRWAARSREFAAAGRAHFASGRAQKLEAVSLAMSECGSREADQGEVWDAIEEKSQRMGAASPTRAAAAMYERSRVQLEEFVERLEPLPRQAGAIFAINGTVAGMDVFDSAATWRKSMRKLVRSYGLDALDRGDEAAAPGPNGAAPATGAEVTPAAGANATSAADAAALPAEAAVTTAQPARFLEALKRAAIERFPAIGLGEDLRITGRSVAGGGLMVDGRLVHLVAFPKAKRARIGRRARVAGFLVE